MFNGVLVSVVQAVTVVDLYPIFSGLGLPLDGLVYYGKPESVTSLLPMADIDGDIMVDIDGDTLVTEWNHDVISPNVGSSTSEITWSSIPTTDGRGGLTDGIYIPYHTEGVWIGGGFTNGLPLGSQDFQTGLDVAGMSLTLSGQDEYLATRDVSLGLTYNYTRKSYTGVIGESLTLSVEAKAGSTSELSLRVLAASTWGDRFVAFDVNTGTIISSGSPEYSSAIRQLADGWYECSISVTLLEAGYWASYSIGLQEQGTPDGDSVHLRNPQITEGLHQFPYVQPASISAPMGGSTADDGLKLIVDAPILSAFSGGPITAIVGLTMGAGSADIELTARNIFTLSNQTAAPMYYRGTNRPVVGHDDVSYANTLGTWSTKAIHYALLQVSADGLQFRSGNVVKGIAAINWSPWEVYSGTFNTGTVLRLAYENEIPLWFRGLAIYNLALTDELILRVTGDIR